MAHNVYIHGLSGAGFRVPKVGGGFGRVTENNTVQVDLDDIKTQLILAGERDNFVRVSGSGATTVQIVGLTRYGFRCPRSSDGKYVVINIHNGVQTVDLTKGGVRRILRRNYGRYIATSSATSVAIYGQQAAQNGFDVQAPVAASATLTSDGTNPAVGDTVTINDKTYRFESTLAQANDVKIGANAAATLVSLGKAVNQNGTVGTDYFTGTTAPTGVSAGTPTSTTLPLTATTAGTAGNSFPSTETSAHLSFAATTFKGGAQTGNLKKVFRSQSITVDPSQPTVFTKLRRFYQHWLEA